MNKKTSTQIIIDQDNDRVTHLLELIEAALDVWEAAGRAWEANNTEETGKAVMKAESDYNNLTRELAIVMGASWRTGYRLHLPTTNQE